MKRGGRRGQKTRGGRQGEKVGWKVGRRGCDQGMETPLDAAMRWVARTVGRKQPVATVGSHSCAGPSVRPTTASARMASSGGRALSGGMDEASGDGDAKAAGGGDSPPLLARGPEPACAYAVAESPRLRPRFHAPVGPTD